MAWRLAQSRNKALSDIAELVLLNELGDRAVECVQGLLQSRRPQLQRNLQRLQLITLPICCLIPQSAALSSILLHRASFRHQVNFAPLSVRPTAAWPMLICLLKAKHVQAPHARAYHVYSCPA